MGNVMNLGGGVGIQKPRWRKETGLVGTGVKAIYGMCYGNGYSLALAYGEIWARSVYGSSEWTLVYSESDYTWISCTYGDGKFVVYGHINGSATCKVLVTEDLKLWNNPLTFTPGYVFQSMVYRNGKIVMVSNGTTDVCAVIDENYSYTMGVLPGGANWEVTYGNGMFVAAGSRGDGTSAYAAYSEDGLNWTYAALPDLPESVFLDGPRYGAGMFLCAGRNYAAYSTDGKTWVKMASPTDDYTSHMEFGGDKFVLLRGNFSLQLSAEEVHGGAEWQKVSMPGNDSYTCICYGAGQFFAFGQSNNFAVLKDTFDIWA